LTRELSTKYAILSILENAAPRLARGSDTPDEQNSRQNDQERERPRGGRTVRTAALFLAATDSSEGAGEPCQGSAYGHETKGADLYYSEILAAIYGFPSERLWELRAGELTDQRKVTGKKFDRQAIGLARYNRAQAAISRAMRRLESRGLITWVCGTYARWSGCNLTPLGLTFSKTVNTVGNCRTS